MPETSNFSRSMIQTSPDNSAVTHNSFFRRRCKPTRARADDHVLYDVAVLGIDQVDEVANLEVTYNVLKSSAMNTPSGSAPVGTSWMMMFWSMSRIESEEPSSLET